MKNSHATSTKCQYHVASNPKWWLKLKLKEFKHLRQTVKKAVPINTCKPWKPVAGYFIFIQQAPHGTHELNSMKKWSVRQYEALRA